MTRYDIFRLCPYYVESKYSQELKLYFEWRLERCQITYDELLTFIMEGQHPRLSLDNIYRIPNQYSTTMHESVIPPITLTAEERGTVGFNSDPIKVYPPYYFILRIKEKKNSVKSYAIVDVADYLPDVQRVGQKRKKQKEHLSSSKRMSKKTSWKKACKKLHQWQRHEKWRRRKFYAD